MSRLRSIASNKWVTWAVALLLLVVLAVVFRDQLDFIGEAIRELQHADPFPLFLAVLAAAVAMLAMSRVTKLLMAAGGVQVNYWDTVAVTMASNSWSTSLPGGPAFSAILTYRVQRSWGASILLCGWFFIVSGAISNMWLIVIAVSAMVFQGADFSVWSLVASFAVMVVAGWAVYWLMRHPDVLESWVRALLPRVNRLLRRDPEAGLEATVTQIQQLDQVHFSLRDFAIAASFSLLNRLSDALCLALAIWATAGFLPGLEAGLNQTTIMGVGLAYITGKLTGSVQVTPGGVGTVDAAIIAVLVATGMTAVDATAAAIVYRAITFALITAIGWVIYFLYYVPRGHGVR